jgi:hypothetical protein
VQELLQLLHPGPARTAGEVGSQGFGEKEEVPASPGGDREDRPVQVLEHWPEPARREGPEPGVQEVREYFPEPA